MFADDPIHTTLPVELRGIRFPSTMEGAKLTTRSEWSPVRFRSPYNY